MGGSWFPVPPRNAYAQNTKLILNISGSTRNPADWDEPAKFKPDRFLDKNGHFVDWNSVKTYLLPFRTRHRSCMSEDFAQKMVFSLLSSLLHQYTLDLPGDLASRPVRVWWKEALPFAKGLQSDCQETSLFAGGLKLTKSTGK